MAKKKKSKANDDGDYRECIESNCDSNFDSQSINSLYDDIRNNEKA